MALRCCTSEHDSSDSSSRGWFSDRLAQC